MVVLTNHGNVMCSDRRSSCLGVSVPLYLAHFAGPAGAAALLKAPDDADAAAVMAKADASSKTKREQIVKANPFLDRFTAADIRRWADRKMDGPTLVLTELLSAATNK